MALFTPAQLEELRRLNTDMLTLMRQVLRHENPPAAQLGEMMGRLRDRYGMQGAAFAVRAWLDAVIDAAPTFTRGQVNALVFANSTGTGYQDPRELSPDYRWASAALLARVNDDQVSLYKLIDQLPANGAGLYLLRVLHMSAELLNAYDTPDRSGRPVRVGEVVQFRAACPR